MDPPVDDPWLIGLVNIVVLGSAATWIWIIARWRLHGAVLAYEPRRPVPWGSAAALLAVVFALLAVFSLFGPVAEEVGHEPDRQEIAAKIAAFMISQLLVVGGFLFVIAVFYRLNAEDLGLPRSTGGGLRDVAVGIVTCFAALVPVRITQAVLLWLLHRQEELSRHPLIETLTSGGALDTWVMLLAFISTVVVAPICEEIGFRLLFQGWLEKWEDEQLGSRTAPTSSLYEVGSATTFSETQNDEARMTNDETSGFRHSSFDIRDSSLTPQPRRGVFGLPHGWLPILASSLLFGVAHAGYGPEPVPLFIFAIFLGYVFQRTHRIVPCIVAHSLFNLVSMLALWRIMVQAVD